MQIRLTIVYLFMCSYKFAVCQVLFLDGNRDMNAEDISTDNVGSDLNGMKALFNATLSNYDTRIRPRINQSHIIQVNTTFFPLSVLHFDTAEQKFSILGYFMIKWKDEVITWNPEDYSGTNYIKVPIMEIWTPNLIILKAFNGGGKVGNFKTDIVKVWSDGSIQWVPESIYSVVCRVNIKYYPFDHQVCTLTYYVSGETITTVVLDHPIKVNLDKYTENSAWKITSLSKGKHLLFNTYHIIVEFHLQRRANFATFTLIMPLLMLAFLNICIFLVPVGTGEKGTFAITIFLAYIIFVTIVSDTLPDNSLQISYFLLFIIVLLFMSVLSVVYTIIQSKLLISFGDKECRIKCIRQRKRSKNKAINFDPTKDCTIDINDHDVCSINTARNDDVDSYSWAMFFEKLDVIFFVIVFALVVIATIVFFILIVQKNR